MGHIAEDCDCPWARRYPFVRSQEIAVYLRELAERCERGEIRHVSVSVHPVPDNRLSIRQDHGR